MTVEKVAFEDALDRAGLGKFTIVVFLLSSALILANTFEIVSVAYVVPSSACELGSTNAQQGIVAGIPLTGIIATSHIWGYLADTRGRKRILVLSLIIGFTTGMMATFSPNWIVLAALKFMSSSALSGTYALTLTLMSELTPRSKRFIMILTSSSIFLFATAFMAVLTIPILPLKFSFYIPFLGIYFNSWRLLNLIFSLPALLGAIGISFMFESPKYLLTVGEDEKALEILRKIYAINTGQSEDNYMVSSLVLEENTCQTKVKGIWSSIVTQTIPLIKPPLLKNMIILSVVLVTVFFGINPYTVWLPTIADGFVRSVQNGDQGLTFCEMFQRNYNLTVQESTKSDCSLNHVAMVFVFCVNMFLAVLNVVLGLVKAYCGRKRLMVLLQLIPGAAALAMNFSTSWLLSGILLITFLAALLNFGFINSYSLDIFPTYVRAMAVCLTMMIGRGSSVVGINILKSLLVNNCQNSFYIFGGITILGGFLGMLLPSEEQIAKNNKKSQP